MTPIPSSVLVYPHEDRARVRASIDLLTLDKPDKPKGLATKLRESREQGIVLSTPDQERLVRLTRATDPDTQMSTLLAIADQMQSEHMGRLKPLALREFNAFCEYIEPLEPPSSPWHRWLTDKLQEIEFDPALNRFILNCPPGHAKPLHVDTMVLMGDGSFKRLGDVAVGDEVVSDQRRIRKVTHVHEQGVLPMLKITTEDGRVIWSAYDHSFRVGLTWKQAQALRPGDELDIIGRAEMEPHGDPAGTMVMLAAWWTAYGSTSYPKSRTGKPGLSPSLWLPTVEHARKVRALLNRMGVVHAAHPINGGYSIRITPTKNRELVEHLNLAVQAHDRRVPAWLFTANDDAVRAFLELFISERAEVPKRYTNARLICYMRSQALAIDLQRLLARLGVPASVSRPDPEWGGRPYLTLGEDGVKAYAAAGLAFASPLRDRVAATLDAAAPADVYPDGFTDKVRTVEVAADAECRCLTVAHDHTFLAETVSVHNSTYASRLYVSWRLGRNPNLQIIGGGHGQTFVENEFSSKIRTIVNSPAYKDIFPNVVIDHSQRAKGQWRLSGAKGQYVAKGVGQGVHGFRAHMVVVDDPYAKVEDAESPAYRERVNTWFLTDIGTRLLPGGKIFVIMTRFHEEDLTGMLIELNKRLPDNKKYTVVAAPAVCFDPDNDVLSRRLGEVLWDFYSLDELIEKKISQNFQRFSLIYQQNAEAASPDNIASYFRYYDTRPDRTEAAIRLAREKGQLDDAGRPRPDRADYFRRVVLAVDTATKDTARADYSVIQVWGETHTGDHYLLDQKREKVELPKLIELIETTARQWDADQILIEDKGNGTSYIQTRGASESQRRLAPCPIVPIKVDSKQGKVFRFDSVTPLIQERKVYLPANAPWLDLFVKEIGQFPEGANDDQVDALAHYLMWSRGRRSRYGSKKVASMG